MTYVDALQTTLAAEHAAVFVLGYLGAQTSRTARPQLAATIDRAYVAHRGRRDQLLTRVRDAGEEPVAAEPAYDVADVGGDAGAVVARALRLERDCAATYAFLVASSPVTTRRFAIDLLLDAAVRGLSFGGEPETLPGT